MFILIVGFNHKTAPVEVRERLTFTKKQTAEALDVLKAKKTIAGCAILATCNRTEIYAAVEDSEAGLACIQEYISEKCGFNKNEIRQYLYIKTLHDGVRHIFRVASGLDSMVLGETQVLSQVKEAYEIALANNSTNGILNTLFQQAISVGKRVRTETLIDQNPVSISYVAVELAKQVFNDLSERKVLVVGAGEMSALTAKHLQANGVKAIIVSSRSYDKAVAMAEEFQATAVHFEDLFEEMVTSDIVISATAARHTVMSSQDIKKVMQRRNNNPLLLIDIAVPRDVDADVAKLENVTLYDIDEMQNVIDKNLEERKVKALAAEEIVEEEMDNFFAWLNSLFIIPTIVSLQKKAEKIKSDEMERAINRLGSITYKEEKIIGSMASSIVKQLLHDPIIALKHYANSSQGHMYSEICQNLFNLEIEGQKPKINRTFKCSKKIISDGDEVEEQDNLRNQRKSTCSMADQMGIKKVKRA